MIRMGHHIIIKETPNVLAKGGDGFKKEPFSEAEASTVEGSHADIGQRKRP